MIAKKWLWSIRAPNTSWHLKSEARNFTNLIQTFLYNCWWTSNLTEVKWDTVMSKKSFSKWAMKEGTKPQKNLIYFYLLSFEQLLKIVNSITKKAHDIYLNISSISWHKILINKTSSLSNPGFRWINATPAGDLRIIQTLKLINKLFAHTCYT